MKKYDVCVIGSGPAGFAAVSRAVDLNKKVCLIEKQKVGGAGVFNGALSSKTMWELSQNYRKMISSDYGYFVYEASLDFASIVHEVKKAENFRYRQFKSQLDYFVKMGAVDYYHGKGRLVSKHIVEIQNNVEEHRIEADNIVLAVGSRPRRLKGIPIDDEIIMTSDSIQSLRKFPESIVILGAGVIGCEYATIFSNYGKTKVFLIDKAQRILPFEDADISETVADNLTENGVHIHRQASLKKMEIVDGRVQYTLVYDNGLEEVRDVEKALISVGRVPNSEGLGLEEVGVKLNDRGFCIDDDTQTSVPNIYAVGDLTADIALVNIAELEGRHAIDKMYGLNAAPLKYNNISTIMFLNPEVSAVGLNEQQARQKGIAFRVAKLSYKLITRAIAMRANCGFIKLITTDDDELRLLGMRVLGPHASSTIESVSLLISQNGSARVYDSLVLAHPSIPEGIQECARMLMGRPILKPGVYKKEMECYRVSETGQVEDLLREKGSVSQTN